MVAEHDRTMTGPTPDRHMVQLDGLRAVAVFLVIVEHQTRASLHIGISLGGFGVWLFYVLSGYLITGILVRSREKAELCGVSRGSVWFAFWARRALRIFPLYYLAIFLAVALGLGSSRSEWPWYATFLGNVRIAVLGEFSTVFGHFWSLAVEEQFYLLWPAACFFLPRRLLVRLAIASVLLAPCLRFILLRLTGNQVSSVILMPCCLDGLGLGAVLALNGRGPRVWAAALGLALGLGVAASRRNGVLWSPRTALEPLSFSLISWWLVGRAAPGFHGWAGRVLAFPPLVYLGRISFGVYVIHLMVPATVGRAQSILNVWLRYPHDPGGTQLAYVSTVSVALASLSWYLMERPLNDLKRFFPYVQGASSKELIRVGQTDTGRL
jgi:peptidoglycan/LPS O-acetylase OafA/YrhL